MAGLPDPMRYKKYWGQYSGDYDNNREIETYDNMMAEYAGIYGIPILYYTLNIDEYKTGLDPIHGENSTPKWDRVFQITAMAEGWTQELQKITAFGLENLDEMVIHVHRSTYDRLVGARSESAPIDAPNLTSRPSRRGNYGPAPLDLIFMPHNGLTYEVVTGGLHFLESNSQMFGHKFWYKLTLKQRETSAPTIGNGEQYGPVLQNISLEEYATMVGLPADHFTGNPQFIVPTPKCDDLRAPFQDPSLNPATSGSPQDACGRVSYTTTGGAIGPVSGTEEPADTRLEDGRIASKYKMQTPKSFSNKGENEEIQQSADQVIDPMSDRTVNATLPSGRVGVLTDQGIAVYEDDGSIIPTDSEDYRNFIGYNKYGPTGRVVRHSRDLWGQW